MSSADTQTQWARRTMRWLSVLLASVVSVVTLASGASGGGALTLSHAHGISSPRGGRTPSGVATAKIELVLLHGTKADRESIPADYPELKNPPWNAYNHYTIVLTRTLALSQGTTSKESLPDGSALETSLLEPTQTSRFRLEVVVKDAKGTQVSKGTYNTPQGKHFLPVQVPYKGGGLVVSLKVM